MPRFSDDEYYYLKELALSDTVQQLLALLPFEDRATGTTQTKRRKTKKAKKARKAEAAEAAEAADAAEEEDDAEEPPTGILKTVSLYMCSELDKKYPVTLREETEPPKVYERRRDAMKKVGLRARRVYKETLEQCKARAENRLPVRRVLLWLVSRL